MPRIPLARKACEHRKSESSRCVSNIFPGVDADKFCLILHWKISLSLHIALDLSIGENYNENRKSGLSTSRCPGYEA